MIDVVTLTPTDWPLWRRMRLAALAESPGAFGSTLAQWTGAGDTEGRWRARLQAVPFNAVVTCHGEQAGMVGCTAPPESDALELISLWVGPAFRGRGIGDAAVRAVLGWAADTHPGEQLILAVKTDNEHAVGLYRRHGFVDAGPNPADASELLMVRPAEAEPHLQKGR